jgi:inosose dehydratase
VSARLLDRVAGAPITWGVCEVPGWGHQMPPERVLAEMREIGLSATEVGPEGFLPAGPAARAMLARVGLRAVAAFVPVVLHVSDRRESELSRLRERASDLGATGATVLVLSVSTGRSGYEGSAELGAGEWRALGRALDEASRVAAEGGMLATVHPHVGTIVQSREEVARLLDASEIAICLDTGHLVVGGSDPASLARQATGRIGHVHLKDVDGEIAGRVRAGDLGYRAAVAGGMYRRLGEGDAGIADTVRALEGGGYAGWHVLEQDAVVPAEPEAGGGPVEDARASLAFLGRLWGEIADDGDLRSAAQGRA